MEKRMALSTIRYVSFMTDQSLWTFLFFSNRQVFILAWQLILFFQNCMHTLERRASVLFCWFTYCFMILWVLWVRSLVSICIVHNNLPIIDPFHIVITYLFRFHGLKNCLCKYVDFTSVILLALSEFFFKRLKGDVASRTESQNTQ